jgi:hypothetical protein
MTQSPDGHGRQLAGPWPARYDHHPGRRVLSRLLVLDGPQARDEGFGIAAPVGMMFPDELPAPPPGFLRPILAAAACHFPLKKTMPTAVSAPDPR